jgi:hypothetical protein
MEEFKEFKEFEAFNEGGSESFNLLLKRGRPEAKNGIARRAPVVPNACFWKLCHSSDFLNSFGC